MSSNEIPTGDPMQLPLPGLDIQEPLKRGGFTIEPPAELPPPDDVMYLLLAEMKRVNEQLSNVNASLEDICSRISDFDEEGYRRR